MLIIYNNLKSLLTLILFTYSLTIVGQQPVYIIMDGCSDPTACNYDPTVGEDEDDDSCDYETCAGCTDSTACNYDAVNTIDDGSCVFGNEVNITIGGGFWDSEISWSVLINDIAVASGGSGSQDFCIVDGCYTLYLADSFSDGWNNAIYTLTDLATGSVIMTGSLDTAANGDGSSYGEDYFAINSTDCGFGCTDNLACNYDPDATQDVGTCNFDCVGCMDDASCNYDSTALQDDGSCLQNDICGVCGGDDSTCSGCTDIASCNYDSTALQDDDSCEYDSCSGCTDISACNFDENAIIDGDCIFSDPICGCYEINFSVTDSLSGGESSDTFENTGTGTISNVTIDLYFDNYLNNGSWPSDMVVQIGSPDGTCIEFGGYNYASGVCASQGNFLSVYPATWQVSTAGLYNAVVDLSGAEVSGDGDWTLTIVNGWTASSGAGFVTSISLSGICPYEFTELLGCTDFTACNYEPSANTEDGSCSYSVDAIGVCGGDCESDSDNDGICDLQLCVEDLNSDGIISVQDILTLLSDFGCNSMCEYDLNLDGAVSIVDLLMMLQAFGSLCDIP